ncbi:MAG: ribosome recycling factor [Candidatus Zapsychrus exili]|nr:ribosome recycling factor [Candidatus Zapsychrus exili]
MALKELLKETENKMKKSIESTKREFSEVRTGRAHPGLIEGLHVDYFGTLTLVKSLASISIPDPRTIFIQPWDVSVIPEIEKAIMKSSLGVNPSSDGKMVKINIPQLSEERRSEMKKVVKDMAEHARISLRTIRRDANDKIKKLETDKAIGEDDGRKCHADVQKLIDNYIKEIDVLLEEKSKILMNQ